MHFLVSIATVLFAIAGIAAAHNVPRATPTATRCDAQVILDTCLMTTKAILDTCGPNDYSCLCTQYTNVLTCYNNCPADQGRFAIESFQADNCNAASLLASTTTTIKPSSTASPNSATTTATSAASSTGAAAAASSSGAAKQSSAAAGMRGDQIVAAEIGGLMALLAAGLGSLL